MKGVMNAVAHASNAEGVLGLVGEMFSINDERIAGPISRWLASDLSDVFCADKQAVDQIKNLHQNMHITRRGLGIKEAARFARYYPPRPLPHTQPKELKVAALPADVPPVRRLVDIIQFEPDVVPAEMRHFGCRLLHNLVGDKLVVDTRAEALAYSRLCYHTPIFCVGDGRVVSQGAAERLGEPSGGGRGGASAYGADSLFLDQQRFEMLKQRIAGRRQKSYFSALCSALHEYEVAEAGVQEMRASVAEQRKLYSGLEALEAKCEQSAQVSRRDQLKQVKAFLDGIAGSKRPADDTAGRGKGR